MLHTLDRRHFLGRLATFSGACLAGRAMRATPIERNGSPKFKFSLAGYSYRNLFKSGEATLSSFIADCAKMQLEGTELTSYYFPDPVKVSYLRELKRECFLAGLDVSGTAIANDFGVPAGEARRADLAHVKRWIEYAEILGAPVIRIFAGHVPKGADAAESHRLMVEGMEECCDYAGQHGVHLALENHGGPTATVEGLMRLVHDVQSPWFGVNLDTGNFRQSQDPYGDLARVAPYAINVQVKVTLTGPDKRQQPTDFGRLASILKAAGYRGYIVLEYEEADDPRVACPKYLDQLRAVFA